MRSFRLSHAGIVIETEASGQADQAGQSGQAASTALAERTGLDRSASLFIDPGNFSATHELSAAIESAANIAAVVITHEHPDHWTADNIASIRAAAPDTPIFTTAATAAALREARIDDVTVVHENDEHRVGPFTLQFYGRRHEVLHSSVPVIDNVGVRVNGVLAWGGDSLVRPPFVADVLGVPIGSPWSNIAQVMDFVLDAAPRRAFLTHDGMLSQQGLGLFRQRVEWCLAQFGGELIELPRLDDDPAARFEIAS